MPDEIPPFGARDNAFGDDCLPGEARQVAVALLEALRNSAVTGDEPAMLFPSASGGLGSVLVDGTFDLERAAKLVMYAIRHLQARSRH